MRSINTSEAMNLLGCSDSTAWQYLVLPIVPQRANATVANATLEFIYDNNFNNAYVTHVCLKREEAQSYKYNSFGDLISVASPSSNTQTFSYSGANLIGQVTPGSGSYAYVYDSCNNITKTTNDKVSMASTYDEIGNTKTTTLTATGSTLKMNTSATYDSTGKFLASSTDATGGTTNYTGNGALGKLTDADNNRSISYGYDGLNRLITMTEYAGTTGVQQYRTQYDDANRLSKLEYKVSPAQNGSFTDVKAYTYTYNNADGSLSAMTMPYGHYDCTYDALKRISTKTLGASNSNILTKAYSYCNSFTDANFTTSLIAGFQNRNSSGGVIDQYSYTYDAVGYITSITDKNSNIVYYTYDNQGQLLTETRGGVTYAYTYEPRIVQPNLPFEIVGKVVK